MKKSNTRICFIVNPVADRKRSVRYIDWIKREAKKQWHHYEINITRKNQNVAELAKSKSSLFDVIVACGGDGTINQVVNGIAGTDTILGVLPIGSGNDFVKSLKLPDSLAECFQILYTEYTSEIDLIHYNGDAQGWTANTIGIGLDGLANYYAGTFSFLRGHLIYVAGALKAAFKFRGREMMLNVDGKSYDDDYLMVTACNGKWEGGSFFLAPEAELNDGIFHLFLIKKLPLPTVLSYLPLLRYGPKKGMKGIETIKSKHVKVQCTEGLAVHSDGEHLGKEIKELEINIIPAALKVISPGAY